MIASIGVISNDERGKNKSAILSPHMNLIKASNHGAKSSGKNYFNVPNMDSQLEYMGHDNNINSRDH